MSPRTKEQNEAIREMRMSQIMQAAAEVYLEKGIQFEIRDVAVKAELGYGTVYHYYKNKQMLLEDLLWEALDRTESAVNPALSRDEDDAPSAERYARLLLRHCTLDPAVFILLKTVADNFHHIPGNRFSKLYAEFQQRIYRPFVALIRTDTGSPAPEQTANLVFGSLVGYAALNIHHDMRHEMDERMLVDLILAALTPKER